MAAPVDGINVLSKVLEQRFQTVASPARLDPFLQEYHRLGESRKGWHLSIIERDPGSQIHWALLIRWPDEGSEISQGFLIAQIQKKKDETGINL